MAQTIQQSDLGNTNTNQPGNPNQNPNQQQSGAGTAPQNQASSYQAGGSSSGSQGSGTSATANPNQQKGSGYTNIQKIISANQGNQLGSTVAGGIQNQGQQLQSNLSNAQNQFNQGVQQNQANTSANQQLVQNVLGNASAYAPGGQNSNQASQFQNLISGQYQGPTQLQNAQQLQNQAQNVSQLNQALNTSGGRAGLLQQFVGNPQYTQGQQSLDALLLGQQNNNPQLAAARQSTAQLGGQVNNAVNAAQAQGQQQAQQAQMFGQNVQNQLGQTVAGLNTNLQQQAQTAQNQRNSQYQKALTDLQSGNVTQDEANLLGLSQGQQVTQNALQNVGQYLQENPVQASAQNVATGQNYATIDALRQLAGQNAPQSAQNILGQYAGQEGQAGQFGSQSAYNPNSQGFNDVNSAQIADYNNQQQAALQAAQNAQNTYNNAEQQYLQAWQAGGGAGGNAVQQGFGNIAQQDKVLAAQKQSAYQNVLNSLQQQYGGLQNINITNPTASTNDAVTAANTQNLGLDNIPGVS